MKITYEDWCKWFLENIPEGSKESKTLSFKVKKGQTKEISEIFIQFTNDMIEKQYPTKKQLLDFGLWLVKNEKEYDLIATHLDVVDDYINNQEKTT